MWCLGNLVDRMLRSLGRRRMILVLGLELVVLVCLGGCWGCPELEGGCVAVASDVLLGCGCGVCVVSDGCCFCGVSRALRLDFLCAGILMFRIASRRWPGSWHWRRRGIRSILLVGRWVRVGVSSVLLYGVVVGCIGVCVMMGTLSGSV